MKAKCLTFVACVLVLAGCATTQQTERTNTQIVQLHQDLTLISSQLMALQKPTAASATAPPPSICYLGGQPYSKGAVIAGRICDDVPGPYPEGTARPVSWQLYLVKH